MTPQRNSTKRFGLTLARGATLLAWLMLALLPPGAVAAQEPAKPKGVLALYWYGKDVPANVTLDKSIQEAFRAAPAGSIEYYAEYLEENRFPGESQSLLLRDYLRQKYADHRIDVLIALSNASLNFLLKYRNDLFPNTPIVFHTMSRANLGKQTDAGLTAVVVDNAYRNTVDLALKLHPATEQVLIITGMSERDKELEAEVRQELKEFESRVALTSLSGLKLDELRARVKKAPARSIILYVRYSQGEPGMTLDAYNALTLISEAAKVPVYSGAGSLLGHGTIGGHSASLEDCGTKAAEAALRIVNGARPKDMPIVEVPTVPAFDWRQLRRWGISEERLPKGSIIHNREPTFWEQYKWWIIGSISLCALEALLIIALLVQRTRRKRVEEALRESEEEARRTLVEQMLAGVVELDATAKFALVNQRFCDIVGYPEAELLEMRMQDITHPDDFPRCAELFRHLLETGESFVFEKRYRRKDGSEVWVNNNVSPVCNARGKIEKAVAVAIDVTDRKRVEREREQLLKQEKAARAEAQAANQSKDEFLAVVSHELRSPLNSILGYARLLRRGTTDAEEIQQTVEIIERNGRMQLQLIEDLLDTARILSGKLELEVQPVALAGVITAALDVVRPAAQAKGIELLSDLDPLADQITGDPDRLQQIVWNLLSNAIKFTPRSGRVVLRMDSVDHHILITVSDTGKGIEPEFLPFVFDRFRQSDSSSARRFGGLGLGLSLVKQLAELHGGTVEAASDGPGCGATFTVTLPQHADQSETFTQQQSRAAPAREVKTEDVIPLDLVPSLAGVRVLVVDDQEEARLLLMAALGECGAQVMAVSSGVEALAILADPPGGERPDVLILDIAMPDEDGYMVLEKVRALEAERGVAQSSQIPAIALTALGRSEDRLKAFAAGFRMHVAKPVEPAELAMVIASLVDRLGVGNGAQFFTSSPQPSSRERTSVPYIP
ncbi:MAG: ABC transporter substrate binding protein [Blastocatellia bacterium]